MTLSQLQWDPWDSSKPTLWQVSYLNQLVQQTNIHVDVDESRVAYHDAISELVQERSKLSK